MIRVGVLSVLGEEEQIHKVIERASPRYDLVIETVDRFSPETPVINRVLSLLNLVDVVVADIRSGSPSLFYEVGLAHGIGKPVLLIVDSASRIPADLLGHQYLVFHKNTESEEQLAFSIGEHLQTLTKRSLRALTIAPRLELAVTPEADGHTSLEFRDLYAFTGAKRGRLLERWFLELAKSVPGWEIIQSESQNRDEGYDLLIWNSLEDPEFQALGNPIPIEFKALRAFNVSSFHRLLDTARRSKLRSLVLITTAQNDAPSKRMLDRLRNETDITAICLDREDLIDVRTPKDLVYALKKSLLDALYRRERYV